MRDKKTYIILILMLVVFLLVMFLMFGIDELKRSRNQTTLIVDNTTWVYKNKRWRYVSNSDNFESLNWKAYQIFDGGKSIGNYYLWHDDKWYVFDKNKNAIQLENELFAYNSDYNVDIKNITKESIIDRTYVDKVLSDNDLDINSKFTSSYKISSDIDNDGIKEEFYVLTNAFPLDFTPKDTFSIVFMVKDNEIYNLYTNVKGYTAYDGCSPDIKAILDLDEDDTSEIVLTCYRYDNLGRIDMLYRFNEKEFKILISNQ